MSNITEYVLFFEFEDLICHRWTDDDNDAMGPSPSIETKRDWCENVLGYTFTQGQNEYYPNCETCWCCKPIGIFLKFKTFGITRFCKQDSCY